MNVLKNLLKIIFAFVFSITISAYHFFVLGFFVSSAKKGDFISKISYFYIIMGFITSLFSLFLSIVKKLLVRRKDKNVLLNLLYQISARWVFVFIYPFILMISFFYIVFVSFPYSLGILEMSRSEEAFLAFIYILVPSFPLLSIWVKIIEEEVGKWFLKSLILFSVHIFILLILSYIYFRYFAPNRWEFK